MMCTFMTVWQLQIDHKKKKHQKVADELSGKHFKLNNPTQNVCFRYTHTDPRRCYEVRALLKSSCVIYESRLKHLWGYLCAMTYLADHL